MNEPRHRDTVIVDKLTAWLNREPQPSGADAIDILCELIKASGRPLLSQTWDICADIDEDRYGISTGLIQIGDYRVRAAQATERRADVIVSIDTPDGDDFGLAIVVNGRRLLDPMTCTWRSTVPPQLQLTPEAKPRR